MLRTAEKSKLQAEAAKLRAEARRVEADIERLPRPSIARFATLGTPLGSILLAVGSLVTISAAWDKWELQQKVEEANQKVTAATGSIQTLSIQAAGLNSQIGELSAREAAAKNRVAEQQAELSRQEVRRSDLQRSVDGLEKERERLTVAVQAAAIRELALEAKSAKLLEIAVDAIGPFFLQHAVTDCFASTEPFTFGSLAASRQFDPKIAVDCALSLLRGASLPDRGLRSQFGLPALQSQAARNMANQVKDLPESSRTRLERIIRELPAALDAKQRPELAKMDRPPGFMFSFMDSRPLLVAHFLYLREFRTEESAQLFRQAVEKLASQPPKKAWDIEYPAAASAAQRGK